MIDEPHVQEIPNGYRFVWAIESEALITIWVRRVQESKGAIYGEFEVEYGSTDYHPLIGIKINLTTKRGRNDIINRIKELNYPASIPWSDIIEQVCGIIIKRHRLGEPGITIEATDEDVEVPQYFIEPFIMKGVPNVLFGDKGSQKTTMSLLLAACITLPWTDNPLGFSVNSHHKKVVFLDWESESSLIKYTLARLKKGMDIPYFFIDYRRCRMPLPDDVEQIANYLHDTECELVIIDSLGAACGGDLYKPEPALRFFESLRSLKVTSLIIAQNAKSEDNKKSIFGSAYFGYYSRNIFEIKHSVINPDETSIALFHKWSNYSKQYEPVGFRFAFTPQSISVETEAVKYSEFLEKVNRQEQALELLSDGPLSTNEIKEGLEISRNNTDKLLARLKDKKLIVKTSDNKWGLTTNVLM